MSRPPALSPTVYAVYAKASGTRDDFLGYATGTEEDICGFYADQKGYGLYLKIVFPQHIPAGFADKRNALLQERAKLEKELKRIDKEIKNIGG
jgi:hypothetical protein